MNLCTPKFPCGGCDRCTGGDDTPAFAGWPPEPISVEFTFAEVDPALLGLLTGGAMGTPPEPTFAVEIHTPIKRTFWQWLRRKPVLYNHTYIPHARMVSGNEEN